MMNLDDAKEYPVVMGSSMVTTMRYDFFPTLVDPTKEATFDDTTATVVRPQRGAADATFAGHVASAPDTECILVFDGEKFILERIERSVQNLRVVR